MKSTIEQEIIRIAKSLKDKTILRRRDFHKYPEAAWTEFRTASIVAQCLHDLGYTVMTGNDVHEEAVMMGVPSEFELEKQMARAIAQGAGPDWVSQMTGGKTGIVGIFNFDKPGPVVALRFDMDANALVEAEEADHRPFREGFASMNKGIMHACGHDGHMAIGLATAEILAGLKAKLRGAVKLIFQPAEEGVRGAKAIAARGVVDDVNYMIGLHLGMSLNRSGQIACKTTGFLATTKFNATFTGIPAHAAATPENGRNAILAACTATLSLHAIPRHGKGASFINVGVITGGSGRNVIPEHAKIMVETRGVAGAINDFMFEESKRIIKAAAQMYGCKVSIELMGSATEGRCDEGIAECIHKVAMRQQLMPEILSETNIGGSEDYTYFMERVQKKGGQAAYIIIGTELAAGHHCSKFDFNEESLISAAALISEVTASLL